MYIEINKIKINNAYFWLCIYLSTILPPKIITTAIPIIVHNQFILEIIEW